MESDALPAVAWIDSNMGWRREDGRVVRHATKHLLSRPVTAGELVLMVDFGDGMDKPFATWGRVIEQHGEGIDLRETAEIGPSNGWTYAIPEGQERADD